MNRFVSAIATGIVAVAASAAVFGAVIHTDTPARAAQPPASFDRQLDPARQVLAHQGVSFVESTVGAFQDETATVERPSGLDVLRSQPLLGSTTTTSQAPAHGEQGVTGWQDDPQPEITTTTTTGQVRYVPEATETTSHVDPFPAGVSPDRDPFVG